MPKHRCVPVDGQTNGVPPTILERFQNVVLALDLMFVNKIPFLITVSHGLHFGTVESLPNCQIPTVGVALSRVITTYCRRGFRVTTAHADPEFEALQLILPAIAFNYCAQNEHVLEIEWYIRTVKDRTRSGYNSLPFVQIPRIMLICLVANAVFWLNAFPHEDSVSDSLPPCYLLTGKHLDYHKHVRLEFGAYVQTHKEHTNDMMLRTIGAICLGPSGNEQGGHYFLSLMTSRHLLHDQWTELPMPHDAIACVGDLGHMQGMPKSLMFADRFGFELADGTNDIDDDYDSAFDPGNDIDFNSADDSDADSFADDVSSTDDSDHDDNFGQPLLGPPAGVDDMGDYDNDSYEGIDDDMNDHDNENYIDNDAHDDGDSNSYDGNSFSSNDEEETNNNGGNVQLPNDNYYPDEFRDETADDDNSDVQIPEINIRDAVISSPPASPRESAGVQGVTTGVDGCETTSNEGDSMHRTMDL